MYRIKKFSLCIFSFLFIYNPTTFSNFNLLYLLTLIAVPLIIINYNFILKTFTLEKLYIPYLFFAYIFIYLLIYSFFGSFDSLYRAYSNFLLNVCALLCAFVIAVYYRKLYNNQSIIDYLVFLGVIQLFFVFLTLFNENVRDWVLSSSRLGNIVDISNSSDGVRSFGLANGYTSTFPMLLGFLSFLCMLEYKLTNNIRYLIFSILFLFSVVINARIGLIPPIMYIAFMLLNGLFSLKRVVKLLFVIFCLSILIYIYIDDLASMPLLKRFTLLIDEINMLFQFKLSGTFLAFYEMHHLPKDWLSMIFGVGQSIGGGEYISSDIGYIIDIYLFGLINTIIQFLIYISLFYPAFLYLNKRYKSRVIGVILTVSIFLFYFKGAIFSSQEFINTLLIILITDSILRTKRKGTLLEKDIICNN